MPQGVEVQVLSTAPLSVSFVRSYERTPPFVFSTRIYIDVLRATTTLSVLAAKQPAEIVCINDKAVCADYLARGYLLFSEVFSGGYGNSPTEALEADIAGRRVVHKSANFSNGLFAHAAADGAAMLAGAFVNLSAVAAAVRARGGAVLIVAAGSFAESRPTVEDEACAELLARAIREPGVDLRPDFARCAETVRRDLYDKPRRLDTGPGGRYRLDVDYALQLDANQVVPRLRRVGDVFAVDL